MCPADTPASAAPTGAGLLCYDSEVDCMDGPNACGPQQPCSFNSSVCSSGATQGVYQYFCALDLSPGALPNGAGLLCFASEALCEAGANPCGGGNPCSYDMTTCSTGPTTGGSLGASHWVCESDVPAVALTNGAGVYCYAGTGSTVSQQARAAGPFGAWAARLRRLGIWHESRCPWRAPAPR